MFGRRIKGLIGHAHSTLGKADRTIDDYADGFGMANSIDEGSLDYLVDYGLWKLGTKLKSAVGKIPFIGTLLDELKLEKPKPQDVKVVTKIDPTVDFEMEREEDIPFGVCVLHGGEWHKYKFDPRAEGYPPKIRLKSRSGKRVLVYEHVKECDYNYAGVEK